jgi:hypothetical protein
VIGGPEVVASVPELRGIFIARLPNLGLKPALLLVPMIGLLAIKELNPTAVSLSVLETGIASVLFIGATIKIDKLVCLSIVQITR